MNLKKLKIKNYKSVEELTLNFENRPVVFTGSNGAGKTSCLQALKFLALGGNPGDLSKMEYLLRRGAKKGYVECELDDGNKIFRQIKPHRIKVNGKDNGIKEGQGEINNLFQCQGRYIEFCLNPEKFIAMDSKGQRERIWEFLSLSITPEIVKEKLELHKLTEAYLKYSDEDRVIGDLDGPYSTFYTSRTEANKAKKNIDAALQKMKDEADAGDAPPKVNKPDAEALKHASETLEGINRLLGQKEAQEKAHHQKQSQLHKLKSMMGELPSWTREQAVERLKGLEEQYSAGHHWLNEPSRLKGELARLQSDHCPSCQRVWDNLAGRQAQRDALEKKIEEATAEAKKVRELKERCNLGRQKIQAYDQEVRAREKIDELTKEVENYHPPRVDESQLKEAREKFNNLNAQMEAWQKYNEWRTRRERLRIELEDATNDWNILNELVNLFGPNGIKFQVFAPKLEQVCRSLNGTLGLWDIVVRFNSELEMEICRNGVWRLLDGASDGERIMVSLAVQVWVSEETGLNIVCIDRLEALDRTNFQILLDGLCELINHEVITHALVADVGYINDPIYRDRVTLINLDENLKGN